MDFRLSGLPNVLELFFPELGSGSSQIHPIEQPVRAAWPENDNLYLSSSMIWKPRITPIAAGAASASFSCNRLPKLDTISFRIGDPAKLSEVIAFAFWIDGDTFVYQRSSTPSRSSIWRLIIAFCAGGKYALSCLKRAKTT
jgi:hypothetical protein